MSQSRTLLGIIRRNHLVLRGKRSPSADAETETDRPFFDVIVVLLADVAVSVEGSNVFADLYAIVC